MNLADASGFQVGLALGLASMASIGPNNLMIIREGLLRRRAIFVASLVWGTYVALLAASWPIGNSVTRLDPAFHTALSWLGLAALAWFAPQSAGSLRNRPNLTEVVEPRRKDDGLVKGLVLNGRAEPP